MRTLWAATIALCLLVVSGRSSDSEVRDHDASQLSPVPARCVAAPLARRTGMPEGQLRLVFVVPATSFDIAPRQVAVLATTERASIPTLARFVSTRSSRGPPHV